MDSMRTCSQTKMKTLSKLEFTNQGREIAGKVISQLDSAEEIETFISRLEFEMASTYAVDHQVINSGDVFRVITKFKYVLPAK